MRLDRRRSSEAVTENASPQRVLEDLSRPTQLSVFQVHSSRDARAVVVHMADLTCRLRDPSKSPAHARHSLALEALQVNSRVPLVEADAVRETCGVWCEVRFDARAASLNPFQYYNPLPGGRALPLALF